MVARWRVQEEPHNQAEQEAWACVSSLSRRHSCAWEQAGGEERDRFRLGVEGTRGRGQERPASLSELQRVNAYGSLLGSVESCLSPSSRKVRK